MAFDYIVWGTLREERRACVGCYMADDKDIIIQKGKGECGKRNGVHCKTHNMRLALCLVVYKQKFCQTSSAQHDAGRYIHNVYLNHN